MTRRGAVPQEKTMSDIVAELPEGQFNATVLRTAIRQHGKISTEPTIDQYVNRMLADGWIIRSEDMFALSDDATRPGRIVVTVAPAKNVNRTLSKIEGAVGQDRHVTIEIEEVQNQ